jgi:ADP-ribose pyrophosphatase YjhB (NUDIX family)
VRPPRPEALLARLPVPARRAAYRAAHALLVVWWALRRPHTQGVKCVITRAGGDVLLVRHTYGDRREWQLPGGGLRRGEAPEAAARRETQEELGITGRTWVSLGTATLTGPRTRSTTLHAFHTTHDGPLTADPGELAEARWFALTALPQRRGPDVGPLVARVERQR